ncbi:Translation initiation factor IF-2 [Labeo rohita]|uniref:Translation initiation factor IF-2 n=1 Tax=Labeo rohita TaxID=84645 RepID=A0ABQ8LAM9_LABRO|nr:Translation initiation factor IF-2 [Labeo rohita]
MLTVKSILSCVHYQDWFAAIDLKDTFGVVQLIWSPFGEAQIDLFASLESSPCTGTQLAPGSSQTLCKIREDEEQVLLVAPYWPTRTWFADLMLLVTAPPWKIPVRKNPSWDLSVVLLGLQRAPFEPLASVDRFASAPDRAHFHQEGGGPACILSQRNGSGGEPASSAPLALLCPVRALTSFRCSEQLFVCFGGQQKGNDVSKQRLAHWVVDAITLAYQCQADICRAAGWVTLNTFARFYSLRVEPVSSRVLSYIFFPHDSSAPPTVASDNWHPWWAHYLAYKALGRLCASFICPDMLACQHLYLNHVTQFRIVAFSRGDPKYVSYDGTSVTDVTETMLHIGGGRGDNALTM